ncbi:hypothetical protein GL279_13920 [Paracoccus limosus]|uniref:Tyrosine-protein kinase G-rich domain-containing protein n=1 Tax=Paracoccus limosus TaxID=913252 RepID=A0A844H418_9RHOB|nr:exopolysaccharide transport family protein [Paracoccus limosus]MTH35699.1 hypothetical protein [Paracoccus limosus]
MNHDHPITPGWRNDVPDFAVLVRRTFGTLRRKLPVLALGSVLAGALATGLALSRPDYYYASSAIMIDPRLGGSGDAAAAPTIYLADALVVDSEIEVLLSDRLLRRVLEKLAPELQGAFADATNADGQPLTPQELQEAQVTWLSKNLTVERQGNTFVIVIGFTAEDPKIAADVANTVAQEYVVFQQDDSRGRVEKEATWLSAEMTRLSGEARQAAAAVQKFIVDNDVPPDGQTGLVGATMTDLEQEIVAEQRNLRSATLFMAQIETDIRRLKNERVVGDLLSLRPDNTALTRLMQQYKDAVRSDGSNQAVISRMAQQLMAELSNMKEAAEASKEVAEANLAKLDARHADLQAELSQIAATQIELGNLQRESDAVKEQQRRVMEQLQRNQSQDLYIVSDTRVIDDAVPPTSPANPPLVLVLASGMIGGLLLAMAWVFVRAQTDDRIRSAQTLRERLGVTYLGAVPPKPFAPAALAEPGVLARVTSAEGREFYESLRRAGVALRHGKGATLVTSPRDEASRAMLTASLAAFVASHGEKVLLVDGDPLGRRLGALVRPRLGDVQVLNPVMDLATPSENLTVALASADRPVDPAAYSAAVRALLAARQAQGEIVIIDGPALSATVDEIIAEAQVTRVLLALPFGKVSLNLLEQILDRNEPVGKRLAGVFLTEVGPRRLRRHDPAQRPKLV